MFGYLNIHSHYSLLRGIAKVPDLLKKAKESGCDAIALTDTNNMYGTIEFYKKAKEIGIKPILGVTLYTKNNSNDLFYPIILLAKNKKGYENILTITTLANFADGSTPSVTKEQLKGSTEGIIAILPSLNNEVQQNIIKGKKEEAEKILSEYKSMYKENIYVGISNQNPTPKGSTKIDSVNKEMISLSDKVGVSLIPLPLIYLLSEGEKEARDVLLRIQKPKLSPTEENIFEDPLIMSERKEVEKWANEVCPKSLKTLSDIIESVDWELELGKWVFPTPPMEKDGSPEEVLREYIEEGYEYREVEKTKEVEDRVEFELGIIIERGYVDYFLSVIDLIKYMHKQRILTTTRGSAAGSMVSYLTRITNVDPIKYQLPFERFLNPLRPSPPDIDIDIADNKRNDVISYIIERFGRDKVAQIGTLGTMMARAAVRDTARALGYSYMNGDRIAKLIPLGAQGVPMYIDKAMAETKELKQLYENDEAVNHIINVAKKIEGNARHISVHAAGVVISPTTVTKYTPLEKDTKGVSGRPITQYNMHNVEDAGLLKFDILGLTNLTILSDCVDLVKEDKGIEIDVDKIEVTDKKTYKMLGDGNTYGVFQLGGSGITSVVKKMRPTDMYDIAAIVALYRPGPMKNIDKYIERKQNDAAEYMHPKMEKYLKRSYGVLVYQDDLLYTAIELAGYDWKEVDVFRKAVGKKIPELMLEQEAIFKKRVIEKTEMPPKKVDKLWELFDPFKGYGFNKAHAISYAKVAYQTAYMKANFPSQYMTAHLSSCTGDIESIAELVFEAKKLGIKILPPDINESEILFSTKDNKNKFEDIQVGLATIKQAGAVVSESIVEERKKGEYKSMEDFLTRIATYKVLNKRNLEALIKVGVFDKFEKRDVLLKNSALLLECAKDINKNASQQSLFDSGPAMTLKLVGTENPIEETQKLYWEKELLGIYISGHPLNFFKKEGVNIGSIKEKEKGSKIMTTAVIEKLNPFKNKSGEKMLFATLTDDRNNIIEAVCFPKEVEEYEELLAINRIVKVKASVTIRNEEKSLKIEVIESPAKKDVVKQKY